MVDVVRDDGSTTSDLFPHEFGRDLSRDACAEVIPRVLYVVEIVRIRTRKILPDRDIFHLGRHNALSSVVQLGHIATGFGSTWCAHVGKSQRI